jgi:hypothetical protein
MRTYDAHEPRGSSVSRKRQHWLIRNEAACKYPGSPAASAGDRTPPGRLCFDSWSRCTVIICVDAQMHFEGFSFGLIRIDGVSYEHDVVIDRGEVRKRKKKASKRFRDLFGHTPLSVEEEIPWKCRRLVIGTGSASQRYKTSLTACASRTWCPASASSVVSLGLLRL